jgi:hypothetical protein
MPSSRRSVLALLASLVGLPLAGPAAALIAPTPGVSHEIRRHGRHYIVNGWVLTARDLEVLGLDAVDAGVADRGPFARTSTLA